MDIEKNILIKDADSLITSSFDVSDILNFEDKNCILVNRIYIFDFEVNNKPYLDILENKYGDLIKKRYHNETQVYNSIPVEYNNVKYQELICRLGGYSNANIKNNLVDAISKIHIIDALQDIQEIKMVIPEKNSNNVIKLPLFKINNGRDYISLFHDEIKPLYIKYINNAELPFIYILKKTNAPIVIRWNDIYFNEMVHKKIQQQDNKLVEYNMNNINLSLKYDDKFELIH